MGVLGYGECDCYTKKMKQLRKKVASSRLFELDLLRGFFVFVIVVDHLQLWPSPLRYLTGEGRLWVTAAEGFFLISGLLIGYIRGHKDRHKPLREVAKVLLRRAGLLYVWGVGITALCLAFVPLHAQYPALPDPPSADQMASVWSLGWAILTTDYMNPWIYFLRLYAIMLAITPLFLWLIRRKKDYIIIGLMAGAYWLSGRFDEAALQWQALFFGAALIGYRLDAIRGYLRAHPYIKTAAYTALLAGTAITMYASYFFTHGWGKIEDPNWQRLAFDEYIALREVIAPYVTFEPLARTRIALAFLWIGGLLVLFRLLRTWLMKAFGWLLLPMGQRSLSVYCLQALLLPLVVILIEPSEQRWANAGTALAVVLLIWGLLHIPIVQRVIPR